MKKLLSISLFVGSLMLIYQSALAKGTGNLFVFKNVTFTVCPLSDISCGDEIKIDGIVSKNLTLDRRYVDFIDPMIQKVKSYQFDEVISTIIEEDGKKYLKVIKAVEGI